MTVRELVSRGRNPHLSWLRQFGAEDTRAVDEALAAVGLADSAARAVDELSGGQRQRAWIAMVLAQQTGLLLLDEPTTYLDLAHQVEVLDLVAWLHAERGRTVVMVLHDLNLAARYAGHLVLVADGRVAAQGPPAEVLTPEEIEAVFGLRASVLTDPHTGGPLVVPRPTPRTPRRRPQ
jgi:iron complex transport system ATP-binding protein